MTRKFKIRFLLSFVLVAMGLLYLASPETHRFEESRGFAETRQIIHQVEMDIRGQLAEQQLDFVAVQDTFQYWWDAMSPAMGWERLEMSTMYMDPREREEDKSNLRVWAKGKFANLTDGSDWFTRWQQLPGIQFEVAVETVDVTMGYLSGSLPVPGQPGKFLRFQDLEVQLHHA